MGEDIHTLQHKLVYAMVVAGKSARFANAACNRFFRALPVGTTPLAWIHAMAEGELASRLREARTGKYEKLTQGLQELADANLDLRKCKPADLERIHGIGPKTSRFWIMWTRPDAQYATLDVHILRWLREQGHDAPKQTPSSRKAYARLEKTFLTEADKRGKTPRELDSEIWEASASAPNVAATRGG